MSCRVGGSAGGLRNPSAKLVVLVSRAPLSRTLVKLIALLTIYLQVFISVVGMPVEFKSTGVRKLGCGKRVTDFCPCHSYVCKLIVPHTAGYSSRRIRMYSKYVLYISSQISYHCFCSLSPDLRPTFSFFFLFEKSLTTVILDYKSAEVAASEGGQHLPVIIIKMQGKMSHFSDTIMYVQ